MIAKSMDSALFDKMTIVGVLYPCNHSFLNRYLFAICQPNLNLCISITFLRLEYYSLRCAFLAERGKSRVTRHVVENVDGYDMILNIQHCMVVGVQTLLGGFPNHHFKKMSRFQSCFICKIITCQKMDTYHTRNHKLPIRLLKRNRIGRVGS